MKIRTRLAILGALLAMVPGCSAGLASSASPSLEASPPASLAPSATAVPLPSDAAPAELKGTWTTPMDLGDEAVLIIGDTSFSIARGSTHHGHISVVGDQIAFSGVSTCAGTGTYTWAIDATGVLTFTPVGDPDPCERVGVLKDHAFVRE